MPAEHRLDPTELDAVVAALNRSGGASLAASHELLAHYVDTGDAPTQRAVNTLIEHAADTLRAITNSFADLSDELRAKPVSAGTAGATTNHEAGVRAATFRAAEADRRSALPRPPRHR